jgi:hypothetical protein
MAPSPGFAGYRVGCGLPCFRPIISFSRRDRPAIPGNHHEPSAGSPTVRARPRRQRSAVRAQTTASSSCSVDRGWRRPGHDRPERAVDPSASRDGLLARRRESEQSEAGERIDLDRFPARPAEQFRDPGPPAGEDLDQGRREGGDAHPAEVAFELAAPGAGSVRQRQSSSRQQRPRGRVSGALIATTAPRPASATNERMSPSCPPVSRRSSRPSLRRASPVSRRATPARSIPTQSEGRDPPGEDRRDCLRPCRHVHPSIDRIVDGPT